MHKVKVNNNCECEIAEGPRCMKKTKHLSGQFLTLKKTKHLFIDCINCLYACIKVRKTKEVTITNRAMVSVLIDFFSLNKSTGARRSAGTR